MGSFGPPVIANVILSVVSILIHYYHKGYFSPVVITHIIFSILFTFLIYLLYSSDFVSISWLLVTMPYIAGFFTLQILVDLFIKQPTSFNNDFLVKYA